MTHIPHNDMILLLEKAALVVAWADRVSADVTDGDEDTAQSADESLSHAVDLLEDLLMLATPATRTQFLQTLDADIKEQLGRVKED